jgi:hypothetical protein
MLTRCCAAAAAVLVLLASPARAQGHPVELGIDAGGTLDLSSGNTVVVGVPVQDFRAGFYVSDRVSIEPRLALNYLDDDASEALIAAAVQLGPVLHLAPERGRAQPYLRPYGGLNFLKISGQSDTQLTVGGALGVKIPIGERLATRIEGSFTHGFESDRAGGGNALGLTLGLSFYTR